MKPITNTRALAALSLVKVCQDGFAFDPLWVRTQYTHLESRDTAFITYLCFGVLRFYPRLKAWLQTLMRQPLKSKDADIQHLLMVGLFQLFYTDTPAFAAIHASVDAVKALNKPWAQGLVNGVLRQAQRSSDQLQAMNNIEQKTAHPEWFITMLKTAWPDEWEKIIAANLEHPPFTLRVNLNQISRENYSQLLGDAVFALCTFSPAGMILEEALPIDKLPGFQDGLVSIQDEAAQLAASLLNVKPGHSVLDACCAPGGKTAHLLETASELDLTALDIDEARLALVKETLSRLHLKANCLAADAASWTSTTPFDRILLDAPCSATGVIRRHPDIKLHRRPQDLQLLVQQQRLLLDNLWQLLKPGGILVYATCSILPMENVDQISHFLQTHPDAKEEPILQNFGVKQTYGRQILPGLHQMDGFYYARLCKQG
jgi:16S rRNA (cytosine967-C5)-methyltransferase